MLGIKIVHIFRVFVGSSNKADQMLGVCWCHSGLRSFSGVACFVWCVYVGVISQMNFQFLVGRGCVLFQVRLRPFPSVVASFSKRGGCVLSLVYPFLLNW